MVPFQLTICGIDELPEHKDAGVSHILSILGPEYPIPEIFEEFDDHHRLDLRFHDIISDSPDEIPPEDDHIAQLLAFGELLEAEPEPTHLLVHCQMGVSRSTAAMILLLAQARPQRSGVEIMAEVARIRPIAWPNLRMITMGDARLERGGDLVSAVKEQYKRRASDDPTTVLFMRSLGRDAEVEGL